MGSILGELEKGTLICDGAVRIHISRDIVSYLFNGSENDYVDLLFFLGGELMYGDC
jgi:hypothetical protein